MRKNRSLAFVIALAVISSSLFMSPIDANAAVVKPGKVTVKLTSYDYNRVKISWSKAKNAKRYRVYQATSKNGKYKRICTTEKRSYIKSNLTTGKTYYYKVRALNGKKIGALSYVKSVKPKLRTVKSFKIVKRNSNSVKITWSKVNGAKGYQIYRATSKNGKYKRVKTTSKLSYINSKLSKNKSYYYKVRAYKKVGKKYVYSSFNKPIKFAIKTKKKKFEYRHGIPVDITYNMFSHEYNFIYRENGNTGWSGPKNILYKRACAEAEDPNSKWFSCGFEMWTIDKDGTIWTVDYK